MEEMEQRIYSHVLSLPDNQAKPFEYRMSRAGDCARLMDYEIQGGTPPVRIESAMRFEVGRALHTMWQKIMADVFKDDFINPEKECSIEVEGVTIKGHPDGEFASLDAVYEFKSVSAATYDMVERQGHPVSAHYEQGNCYASTIGRKWILFHYFNKDNNESRFFLAPVNPELFDRTKQKFKERVINSRSGTIAHRPYSDPTEAPCWFCHKVETCYEGFEAEVSGMGRARITEPEFIEWVTVSDTARTTRLQAEKVEKEFKTKLGQELLRRNLNSAQIDLFTVDVTLGKNKNPIITIKGGK